MSGSVFSAMLNRTRQNQDGAESGDISEEGRTHLTAFGSFTFKCGGKKATVIECVRLQSIRTCGISS